MKSILIPHLRWENRRSRGVDISRSSRKENSKEGLSSVDRNYGTGAGRRLL